MVGEKKLNKILVITAFLLPSLLGLIVLFLIPMAQSLYSSFTQWDLLTAPKFIGFKNYINLFSDENSMNAIRNTFTYVIFYTPLVICLGMLFAIMLDMKLPFIKVYRTLNFVPVILSWVVVSLLWMWLYSPDSGLINYILSLAGIHGKAWLFDSKTAMGAIITASLWKDAGYVTVILLAGLQCIPEDLYESAELDGANGVQKFFHITLPQLSPTIYFLVVTLLIQSFQVFDQVFVMTKGGPYGSTRTMVQEIYENAFQLGHAGFASAQAWFLIVIVLLITVVQNKLQKRWVHYDTL